MFQRHNLWKTFQLVALGGVALQWGGCFQALWANLPITLLMEFVLDNNGVFDLFVDN